MKTLITIARHELLTQWRSHTLKLLGSLLIFLTLLVAFAHWQQQQDSIAAQTLWQQQNEKHWEAQPDRHPHRAGHYGKMAFRTVSPLSFIDSGVNPYVGNALFLEAHRQNSSQFKQYVSSTNYMGLGYLSGATIILVIWPLVLIALAFNAVSGERMQGTLKQLMAQGITLRQLLPGKALAYGVISLVYLLLVFAIAGVFLLMSSAEPGQGGRFFSLFTLYLGYALLWSALVVLFSYWCRTNQQSLSALLLFWLAVVVVLPKAAYSVAEQAYPLPDRAVFDIQTAKAIASVGDAHDPDDPHFNAFRERVLDEYGVGRVEDLPVNWRGLVMQEGERITSEVFAEQYAQLQQQAQRQNQLVDQFAWFSPLLLAKQLSMQFAASDARSFWHYETAAEDYRYRLIQALNQLHTEEIELTHDKQQKVSQDVWAQLPKFDYQLPALDLTAPRVGKPSLCLFTWLLVALVLLISRQEGHRT